MCRKSRYGIINNFIPLVDSRGGQKEKNNGDYKRTVQDKIEVVGEFKHIQVRTATVIEEDGVELSRSFHVMLLHQTQIHLRKVQM